MVRPCIDTADKRKLCLCVRVSPEDANAIRERAMQAGMVFSDYARAMLILGSVKVTKTKIPEEKFTDALNRIVVNLEQLRQHIATPELQQAIISLYTRLCAIADLGEQSYVKQTVDEMTPKLDKRLFFRVTEDQRDVIEARASQAGVNLSTFFRQMLLDGCINIELRIGPKPELLEHINQLGKLLNSSTKQANITGHVPQEVCLITDYISEALEQIPELCR